MDAAYDHIAEQAYANDRSETPKPTARPPGDNDDGALSASPTADRSSKPNLQTELQETFKAFSNSSWGTRLGGFWGNVRKQGESYYTEARKEVGDLGADALKWSEGVREKVVTSAATVTGSSGDGGGRDMSNTVKAADQGGEEKVDGASVDDTDKALQENETFIERFKAEAAKRLKEVQKAEDAADEALLRFGTNIRNFLKDAVSVSAPDAAAGNNAHEVLFESRDAVTGKRVIHTSRFDAQLHVIHTMATSFTQDPETEETEWEQWRQKFDIDRKTDTIAKDLESYGELRSAMEKLVPEKVEYKQFWMRYYFLRHVVEAQEEKRREMLKYNDEEEVGWDDDSDDDEDQTSSKIVNAKTNASTSTLQQRIQTQHSDEQQRQQLKPTTEQSSGRRSHDEKSVADSDASYDLVSASGANSRAPGSPSNKVAGPKTGEEVEDSDEEDWE